MILPDKIEIRTIRVRRMGTRLYRFTIRTFGLVASCTITNPTDRVDLTIRPEPHPTFVMDHRLPAGFHHLIVEIRSDRSTDRREIAVNSR